MTITRLLLLAFAAGATFSIGAQTLDAPSRARLRSAKMPLQFEKTAIHSPENSKSRLRAVRPAATAVESRTLQAFITVDERFDTTAFEALGGEIRSHRGSILLAQFPESSLTEIEALGGIVKISLPSPVETRMDIVRQVTGIDRIHTGDNLPQAFTGKGVVAGIVDGGFDPNHINFKNADGTSRIRQFTYFRSQQNSSDLVEERYGADYIPQIDTENEESFHATHTTGIMAGSYRGNSDVAVKLSAFEGETQNVANPYYGVAVDADIATASAFEGQLSDIYIAYGVESILDCAFALDQPAVINLSLGSNVGPHDGSSPICRYLDAVCADDQVNAIVCISAGNEGDAPIAITKNLTEGDTDVATVLYAMYDGMIPGYQNPRSGLVYIYSDTAEPFEVQALIINKTRNAAAMRMPLAASPNGASQYWCSDANWQGAEGDIISQQFAQYFTGYVGLNAETDQDNGRYYSVIDFTCWDNVNGSNAKANYLLGFIVKGAPGQRIDIYGDNSMCNFSSFGLAGYEDGGFDGTINDIACGHSPIIVGSYNTRDDYASLDGKIYGYRGLFPEGKMSAFTSFGTLIDGRSLPDLCAPGATVISSSNEYYLDAYKLGDGDRQASFHDGDRLHSWHQCLGTSMAAPVVTGTMALWLEAYPELTAADAKRIAMETAVKDTDTATSGHPVQWGAGKFDAYRGLQEVLKLKDAGVDSVLADRNERISVAQTSTSLSVAVTGTDRFTAALTNVAGQTVATAVATDSTAVFDTTPLPRGIYILSAAGQSVKIVL